MLGCMSNTSSCLPRRSSCAQTRITRHTCPIQPPTGWRTRSWRSIRSPESGTRCPPSSTPLLGCCTSRPCSTRTRWRLRGARPTRWGSRCVRIACTCVSERGLWERPAVGTFHVPLPCRHLEVRSHPIHFIPSPLMHAFPQHAAGPSEAAHRAPAPPARGDPHADRRRGAREEEAALGGGHAVRRRRGRGRRRTGGRRP